MVALATAVLVLLADQMSKLWIRSAFVEGELLVVFPAFLNITYVRNRGGAFGIFPHQPLLFVVLSLVTIAAIIYFYRGYAGTRGAVPVAVGLILGGAAGNLLDRIVVDRGGCVIDWLDCHIGSYHWPAFNVADSAICIGVFLLLYMLFMKNRDGTRAA